MEYVNVPNIPFRVSRLGLGTWAIGGSLWGGTNEKESIDTILQSFEKGINLVDTAPAYGRGESEKILGKALKQYKKRENIVIATKFGLQIQGDIVRDLRKDTIMKECEESLKRLGVDYIDLYQAHWPDPKTPLEELAEAMNSLLGQGKILAFGVSNFSIEDMNKLRQSTSLTTLQFPFNLYEQEQNSILEDCKQNKTITLGYSAICRGLLSGKMKKDRKFEGDDLRKGMDPKFKEPHFSQYLEANQKLEDWLKKTYQKPLLAFAIRWVLDRGVDIALWGMRKASQLENIEQILSWKLKESDFQAIEKIISETITQPVGNEFMAPPLRMDTQEH